MICEKPTYINLPKIGSADLGYISVIENSDLIPFDIKRVYWTYYTPQDILRGGHAHKNLQQLIVAVSGKIVFSTEDLAGNKEEFSLDNPHTGLYLPEKIWRDIKFSHSAVLLCLASEVYDEVDYIRNYENFKDWKFNK